MDQIATNEVYTGSKVQLEWQIIVMALNIVAPAISGLTNGLIYAIPGILPPRKERKDYTTIEGETQTSIGASGWAFSIWYFIYTFVAGFLIYQALPSEWVPQRNDEMIYYYMNLIPALNLVVGASWFIPGFYFDDQVSKIFSTVLIWAMLITALACMTIADQSEVWWPEVFLVRLPWSLYSGWLIAANLLASTAMFKSWGMRDLMTDEWWAANPEAWTFLSDLMVISEEDWAIIYLWAAEVFVQIVAWGNRDPIFGLVYAWAGAAVINETLDDRPEDENLVINVAVIAGIHLISMLTMIAYLIFETFQPWYQPLSFWGGGSFGKTNWAEMLTDLSWVLNAIGGYITESVSERQESV